MALRHEIAEVLRQIQDLQGQQHQLNLALGRVMAEKQTENQLTLEKLKLREGLEEVRQHVSLLDGKMTHLIEMKQRDHQEMKTYTTELHALMKQHEETLFGRDGRGGMNADITLLRQTGTIAAWVMGTTGVAVIALVVNQFGKVLLR